MFAGVGQLWLLQVSQQRPTNVRDFLASHTMPEFFPGVSDAITAVKEYVDLASRKAARDDAALRALLAAVNQTKRYLAAKTRGEAVNREREGDLVELWTEAAVQLRRTDPKLARKLQIKAEYWADPEQWTANEVRRASITIEEVAASARVLIVRSRD